MGAPEPRLLPIRRFRTLVLREADGEHRWRFYWRRHVVDKGEELGGYVLGPEYPPGERRKCVFSTKVYPLRQVESILHEGTHITFPDLDEDAVQRLESNLSKMLTAAGVLPARRKRRR